MGAPPPKGEEVWCQKTVDGKPVKDGIFVAYGTGTDRMIQGYYRDGVQDGEWTTWYETACAPRLTIIATACRMACTQLVRERSQSARGQLSRRQTRGRLDALGSDRHHQHAGNLSRRSPENHDHPPHEITFTTARCQITNVDYFRLHRRRVNNFTREFLAKMFHVKHFRVPFAGELFHHESK